MADQAPFPERIADIQRIIRISSAGEFADEHQAKRLLLSEAELATLPEAERLVLYQGLAATIAQLKQAVGGGDRPDPEP
jgi:hypothetical protein